MIGLVLIFIGYPIYLVMKDTIIPTIMEIIGVSGRRKSHRPGQKKSPLVKDHTKDIVPAVVEVDPLFTNDKFIAFAKEVFLSIQYAWMDRNWKKTRPFIKDELYRQYEMQLQRYIDDGKINVIERININQCYLQKYVWDGDCEYLTVFLRVRMTDYIKDEKTGKVLKGSPDIDSYMEYLHTYMRKSGVFTNPEKSNRSTTNCPSCAAAVRITSMGRCELCNSTITTGEYDWVLSNIEAVKPGAVVDNTGVIIHGVRKKKK